MMALGKWLLPVVAVLVAFLAVSCGGDDEENGAEPTATTEEGLASPEAEDPAKLFQQHIEAFNAGDIDAVMEVYTNDAVLVSTPLCFPIECVGKEAIGHHNRFFIADNMQMTIISSEVSGSTVSGSMELTMDAVTAVGLDRLVFTYNVTVTNGKITRQEGTTDLTDPQTADFAARGHRVAVVGIGPGRDGDQSPGFAVLLSFEDTTNVHLTIAPGPAGVPQPVHIHEGTCAALGEVRFPLNDVGGGKSSSRAVEISWENLQTGNFAINVHQSQEEIDVYVACADIPPPEAPGE